MAARASGAEPPKLLYSWMILASGREPTSSLSASDLFRLPARSRILCEHPDRRMA